MVSTIAEQQTGSGLPILILGNVPGRLEENPTDDKQENRFVPVESLIKAIEYLQSNDAAGLIISRERHDISPDDLVTLLQALGSSQFLLLWPPEEIMKVVRPITVKKEMKDESNDPENLQSRIAILEARNASLEALMKTLVAALSQCDPWPEAYAGDEDAWELIMQGIPVADLDAEDFGDTGDDEGSGEEEEYDEE